MPRRAYHENTEEQAFFASKEVHCGGTPIKLIMKKCM
jgi:hypothetical protein